MVHRTLCDDGDVSYLFSPIWDTNHLWLLTTGNVTSAIKEVNFKFYLILSKIQMASGHSNDSTQVKNLLIKGSNEAIPPIYKN